MAKYHWLLPMMKALIIVITTVGATLATLTFGATPALHAVRPVQTPSTPAFPADTTTGIHLGLPFNYAIAPSDEVAPVDYVFGSNYPQTPSTVYNTFYQPFQRDGDATHSLTWWQTQHPDWIAYQCDQQTPAYEFGDKNMPLDIANPAVLAYLLQTAIIPAINKGYPSIAFDNVGLDNSAQRCGVWQQQSDGTRAWHQEYSGQYHDPAYAQTVLAWAKYMRQQIDTYVQQHGLSRVTITMNLSEDYEHPEDFALLAPYFDIDYNEAGFTNWGNGPVTGADWLTLAQEVQTLDAAGKAVILNGEEPQATSAITTAQIQWILANYLLVKGHHTYTYISGMINSGKQQDYGRLILFPEYYAPVGAPLAPMQADGGVYQRAYAHGLVFVNPSATTTYTVQLPSAFYTDLYGQVYQGSLTLTPASGIILLG